jgi:DDE family transposase
MFTTTPLFGKFHSSLRPRLQSQKPRHPLHHLEKLCADLIDPALLATNDQKDNSRKRIYTPKLTFMAFLDQVLNPDSSCRDAVRQIQAYYQSLPDPPSIDSDTSAYCQARARWTIPELVEIRRHLAQRSVRTARSASLLCQRPLKVLDGTCLNMPDTKANRLAYPQSEDQQPQCGFPLVRLVAVFSLQTGALLERRYGPYKTSENALYQELWPTLNSGDIVLGDRNLGSWGALASLQPKGVDGIFRLHASRSSDFRQGQRLGPNDRLVTLAKPKHKPANLSQEQWEQLPPNLLVRLVRFPMRTHNGRSKRISLITTLLNPLSWPVELLAAIYRRRWEIELFLRNIKTTLQMEMLSCKTPAMVHKELEMHLIAYNLIRAFMGEAAFLCDVPGQRLSFKGTLDTARQYGQAMTRIPAAHRQRRQNLYAEMLAVIARDPVPERPDRFEPRCQKLRPKRFPFLTHPRRKLQMAGKDSLPLKKSLLLT